METINRRDISLGLESFDNLGFRSEEDHDQEISKLIKVRSEFEKEA